MKVQGLDGREHHWSFSGYEWKFNEVCPRSSPHEQARGLLHEMFPLYSILQEVPIPGSQLKIDLVIPQLRLCVEVMGAQHHEFNSHFYKSKAHFIQAKNRDSKKKSWCLSNNLKFVELKFDEQERWYEVIQNVVNG
jgi:very-short-patch-repair endonuclease